MINDDKINKNTIQSVNFTTISASKELRGKILKQVSSFEIDDIYDDPKHGNRYDNKQFQPNQSIEKQQYDVPVRRYSLLPSIGYSNTKVKDNLMNNNNLLSTPKCRYENSATTKDSFGGFMSSQKRPQNELSPPNKKISQYVDLFSTIQDIKDDHSNPIKQTSTNSNSEQKIIFPSTLTSNQKQNPSLSKDIFSSIEIFLKDQNPKFSEPEIILKEQKQNSRVNTTQENSKNGNLDIFLRRDIKTLDLESEKFKLFIFFFSKLSQHNLNVDLIQDQKIILNHLQRQQNTTQQTVCDDNTQQFAQIKDINAANLTFYPKQQSPGNRNQLNQFQDQKEVIQSTTYQQEKEHKSINKEDTADNKISKGVDSQVNFVKKGSNEQKHYKTQSSQQPTMSDLNNCKYLLSEGSQIEQQEQIQLNQMKFHNLYQKNVISYQKNYSQQHNDGLLISDKNSIGTNINLFEFNSIPQNKAVNYENNNQYSNRYSQINQQKGFNCAGGFKKYIHNQYQQSQQTQSQQNKQEYMISGSRYRSNSYLVNNMNDPKANNRKNNLFDSSLNNKYILQDLNSVNGKERCNFSVDQININDFSRKYYSENNQLQQPYHQAQQSLQLNKVDISSNGNRNSIKKLSDICLPSLKISIDPNDIYGKNDNKKMNQNTLKIQQNQQYQQKFEQGIEKLNIKSQKNEMTFNKNVNNDKNIANRAGLFDSGNQTNQRSCSINEHPQQNVLIPNESFKRNEQDFNFVTNQEQVSEQLLEVTGRFGPEQQNENQKDIININQNRYINQNLNHISYAKNTINKANQIRNNQDYVKRNSLNDNQNEKQKGMITPNLKKQSQSHQPSGTLNDQNEKQHDEQNDINKSFDLSFIQHSLNKNNRILHTHDTKSKTIDTEVLNKNSIKQHTNCSETISNINGVFQNNIPLITTNTKNNVNKAQHDSSNQGTLLIHYNFPLADKSLNDRSKYYQFQQQQQFTAQNNTLNATQKKVSSAISCKRNEDFYNQYVVNSNDPNQKPQQRAKSSNNKFPREIFTPNVQKAKRLNNQNRQNVNQNIEDNEFLS